MTTPPALNSTTCGDHPRAAGRGKTDRARSRFRQRARRRVRSLIPLTEIQAARERIADAAIRTPLVRLNVDSGPAEVYLKLENLQPIGSFKIRGASNRMALASPSDLRRGVWTASAGNMAQGVAWNARRLGDRKSTRLNSSHRTISYAVFCLKKKKKK